MEPNVQSRDFSFGQVVISSSVVTVLMLVGIAFIAREPLSAALRAEFIPSVQVPATDASRVVTTDVTGVVAEANPAVVSVVVTKDVPIYEQYYEQYDPWGFWGGGWSIPRVRENGTEEREVGGGSGFVVNADGLIVTNRHVVDDPEARYSVLFNDGSSYAVSVVARDPQLDIAILKLDELPAAGLTHLTFGDSTALQLGEPVIAIGNALAEFRNSVSVGVVSGLSRSIVATDGFGGSERLDEVIQTDAAINPGNSGGPLLNIRGEVIGVNVATSRGADNIGFALPAHVVAQVVESVAEFGEIVRPFLGVRYTMVTPRLQEMNNLPVDYGALVIRGETSEELAVMPGSPADKAGVRENDIILALDGRVLDGVEFATALRNKRVGDQVELRLLSQGEERTVSLVLEQAPN